MFTLVLKASNCIIAWIFEVN